MPIASWSGSAPSSGGGGGKGSIAPWTSVPANPKPPKQQYVAPPKLNPYSAGNVISGGAKGAEHGVHLVGSTIRTVFQAIPRGIVEGAESLQPTSTAKAAPKPNNSAPTLSTKAPAAPKAPTPTKPTPNELTPKGKVANAILGAQPIQTIKQKQSGTESSHPGGFKVGPIKLSSREAGAAEGILSAATDIGSVTGAAKAPEAAVDAAANVKTLGVKGAIKTAVKGPAGNVVKSNDEPVASPTEPAAPAKPGKPSTAKPAPSKPLNPSNATQAAEAGETASVSEGIHNTGTDNNGVHNVGGQRSIISQAPEVQAGDTTRQAVLNQKFVSQKYQDFIPKVRAAAEGMSEHDKQLLDTIEGNHKTASAAAKHLEKVAQTADNPEQFRTVVGAMREGYDARLASDVDLGREVGRRNNYIPHIFQRDPAVTATLDRIKGPKTIIGKDTPPGYTKPRTVPSYAAAGRINLTDEAGNALKDSEGNPITLLSKRKNSNALEDFEDSMKAAAQEHGSQALRRGLRQAYPDVQLSNKVGFDKLSGKTYKGLTIPGGKSISMPEELADFYNKRGAAKVNPGVTKAQKALKVYDAGNRGLKYAKLGGGFFHSFTTAGSVLGHQITSANTYLHPITALRRNLRLVASTVSKKAYEASQADYAKSGKLDFARKIGTTLSPKEITADADVKMLDKAKGARLNPIRAVHDMVFQRQIPEAKMMIIQQKMDTKFPGMDYHNPTPAQMAYGRSVAAQVNRLGGINRAVSGMTYQTAQRLSRVVLATDFTEGKFGTLYAALARGGPEGTIARQMVVGKSIVFAIPGVIAAAAAGKIHTNADLEREIANQFVNPSIPLSSKGAPSKSNPGGTPQEAKLPKTFISELASVFAPAISDLRSGTPAKDDLKTSVEDYASARLAALPSTVEQAAANRDFYGDPIYGPDKNGNPQSAGRVAMNLAQQGLPIPAVQTSRTASGKQNVADAVLNTAGLKVGNDPSSAEGQHSAAVNKLYNSFNPTAATKSKISKQVSDLVSQGKINQAMRVATQWNNSIAGVNRNYPDNFNPDAKQAWDAKWNSLKISVSPRAISTREQNNQANANLLK